MNNGKDFAKKLLIVACSARKKSVSKPIRAWSLYDGVFYRVLKKKEERFYQHNNIDVYILSAKYGLINKDDTICYYEQKMNKKVAIAQAPSNIEKLKILLKANSYQEIFISAGQTYIQALEPIEAWLLEKTEFNTTKGPIGIQMHQLKQWLGSQNNF